MNVFIFQGSEFVSEAYKYLEDATAPTTEPTVSSGFRITETTVKVSTWKIVSVVPAFSRERGSNPPKPLGYESNALPLSHRGSHYKSKLLQVFNNKKVTDPGLNQDRRDSYYRHTVN